VVLTLSKSYTIKDDSHQNKFAIGRGFLSVCRQTDDLGWGDTIIWYMSLWCAVLLTVAAWQWYIT